MAQEENTVVSAASDEGGKKRARRNSNKSFMGMSKEKLRHLKVADKFGFTFNRLLIMIGIMVVALGVSIGLLLVGVANILDIHVVGEGSALRGAVIAFYMSNEGLSLLENAAHIGLPVPDPLKNALAQLHGRDEKP